MLGNLLRAVVRLRPLVGHAGSLVPADGVAETRERGQDVSAAQGGIEAVDGGDGGVVAGGWGGGHGVCVRS